jgi:hypothetical protein
MDNMNLYLSLERIKNECKSHSNCSECPLTIDVHGEERCALMADVIEPSQWELNVPPVRYKAFE